MTVVTPVPVVGASIDDLQALLQAQIIALGPETIKLALQHAHLFQGLRALSRLSLQTATTCVQEGLPATLVTMLDPGARSRGERVEMRVLTGKEINLHGN